jgi:hypothetical protein
MHYSQGPLSLMGDIGPAQLLEVRRQVSLVLSRLSAEIAAFEKRRATVMRQIADEKVEEVGRAGLRGALLEVERQLASTRRTARAEQQKLAEVERRLGSVAPPPAA